MNKKQMLVVFKKVVKGLLKQGEQSFGDDISGCKYNGDHGNHCAIGLLIKPQYYKKSLEGRDVDDVVKNVLIKSGINIQTDNDIKFLSALQSIHDSYDNWVSEFKRLARDKEASDLVESLRPKTGLYANK